MVFATQSLADIETSAIAPAIIESCPTRIFSLQRASADRAADPLGLPPVRPHDRQIEIIARAAPKREHYCQSARGNRLFELGLGEVALAFAAAPSKTDQLVIRAGLVPMAPQVLPGPAQVHAVSPGRLDMLPADPVSRPQRDQASGGPTQGVVPMKSPCNPLGLRP